MYWVWPHVVSLLPPQSTLHSSNEFQRFPYRKMHGIHLPIEACGGEIFCSIPHSLVAWVAVEVAQIQQVKTIIVYSLDSIESL